MRHGQIDPQRSSVAIILVFIWILFSVFSASPVLSKETTASDPTDNARIQRSYGKLPLYFIRNDGQVDEKVQLYERGSGHSTFFATDGVYLTLTRKIDKNNVKLSFLNANPDPQIVAEGKQEGVVNYFIGNDPSKWQTGVPTYQAVVYQEIYPGIDIKFYGTNRQIEYDIVVKPGADPSQVKLAYEGIEKLNIANNGDMEIILKEGKIVQKKPVVYQEIEGKQVTLEGKFIIQENAAGFDVSNVSHSYSIEVAQYDKNYALIIDPVLDYSTYLGGSGDDFGRSIAVDGSGNAYVTGSTASTVFPTTAGAFDTTPNGTYDVFVTKLNMTGSALTYSTYLGGSGGDLGNSIALDGSGNAYVTGYTYSTVFPTTVGAYDKTLNGIFDVFVTKLNTTGSALTYSTYLGGSGNDFGNSIAVDGSGNAYVTGYTPSSNFPTTAGAFDTTSNGSNDIFVTKLNTTGSALTYSTYLGGSGSDFGNSIAVDGSGNAYVTGYTPSSNFPTTAGAFDTTSNGSNDVFVTKLNTTGSALTYSTYLGGSGNDVGYGIIVGGPGNAYVTGSTASTVFPTTAGAYDSTFNGVGDVFVTKLEGSSMTDNDNDGFYADMDCNDSDADIHPGATEICNLADDNCNGQVDDGVQNTYYQDADTDTYGSVFVMTLACTVPSGYVSDNTDCDDSNAFVHPGSAEVCNLLDDNCNGLIDEGVQNTYYQDADTDTYGNASVTTLACTTPSGYVANSTDCNDADTSIHPGSTELCNGVDENCNGQIDDGITFTSYYRDQDGDNFGNAFDSVLGCTQPSGRVLDDTDCNDNDSSIHPGATDIPNDGIDQDCSGEDSVTTIRFNNISTRGEVQTGDSVMIGGFWISGTGPKTVLIRARGPSLADFGVAGPLANPTIQLYSGQTVIAQNDDWQTTSPQCDSPAVACGNAADIQDTGFDPCSVTTTGCTLDSAIYVTLPPGGYTAILSGVDSGTGVGIVEVFDVDSGSSSKLVNISTRGPVLTGDSVMIGGFWVSGTDPKSVLLRARGPSLAAFGVNGAMANPVLELYSGQTLVASNDDWQTANTQCDSPLVSCGTVQDIIDTGFDPCSVTSTGCTLDSAMHVTLPPGGYTAILKGVNDGTGVGIVEAFEVAP